MDLTHQLGLATDHCCGVFWEAWHHQGLEHPKIWARKIDFSYFWKEHLFIISFRVNNSFSLTTTEIEIVGKHLLVVSVYLWMVYWGRCTMFLNNRCLLMLPWMSAQITQQLSCHHQRQCHPFSGSLAHSCACTLAHWSICVPWPRTSLTVQSLRTSNFPGQFSVWLLPTSGYRIGNLSWLCFIFTAGAHVEIRYINEYNDDLVRGKKTNWSKEGKR